MNKSYKNTTIAILLACILTMAIGYAVLQQRLDISGTSKITSDFNIQVVGISEFHTEQLASTANVNFTPTSATYSTNLQAPEDRAIYEIVIENKGTLDGYVHFDTYYGSSYVSFPEFEEDGINIGIYDASKVKAESYEDINDSITELTKLIPGEKLYVYAYAEFDDDAEKLPEKEKFEFTVNFDFYTKDYVAENFGFREPLLSVLERTNPFVTSGNGLYYEEITEYGYLYDTYTFRSDANGDVNNYILIGDKMWRITDVRVRGGNVNYKIIEDDDTINSNTVFSTVANSKGFYNGFSSSTLIDKAFNLFYNDQYGIYDDLYVYPDEAYVENTEVFEDPDNESSSNHVLPEIARVMNASTSSSCTFANLSTGGCKSWLTNNGDTYLYAKVYESDKTTNTGKIAYLQNGKVIAVDPQDTNYGEYKIVTQIRGGCDFTVTNADVADGTKANPYIISTDENDICDIIPR